MRVRCFVVASGHARVTRVVRTWMSGTVRRAKYRASGLAALLWRQLLSPTLVRSPYHTGVFGLEGGRETNAPWFQTGYTQTHTHTHTSAEQK
jgi:hypothetical protein